MMRYGVYEQPILDNRRVVDLSLFAKKRDAVLDKLLLHNERRGHTPSTIARVTQLHTNAYVELNEAFDLVDIPGMEVDVVNGRGHDQYSVELIGSMCWQVNADTVERCMVQVARGTQTNMKYAT
jgi:hypothetical protein